MERFLILIVSYYLSLPIHLLNSIVAHLKKIASDIPPTIIPVPEAEQIESYDEAHESPAPAVETAEYPVESDPTIANAGLTEIDAPNATTLTNGHTESNWDSQGIPQNATFGAGAANAAAEANWDQNNDLSTSQEWVEVPRDTAETDTGLTATPAAPSNVQSWADDQPDSPVCLPQLCFPCYANLSKACRTRTKP